MHSATYYDIRFTSRALETSLARMHHQHSSPAQSAAGEAHLKPSVVHAATKLNDAAQRAQLLGSSMREKLGECVELRSSGRGQVAATHQVVWSA